MNSVFTSLSSCFHSSSLGFDRRWGQDFIVLFCSKYPVVLVVVITLFFAAVIVVNHIKGNPDS